MSKENKEKLLNDALEAIKKQFGKESIMQLGDKPVENIPYTPTGSYALDDAIGIGGYPKGRIIEIFGAESSGKTTIALHAIAEAQKLGDIAAFIDAENALDIGYAKNLGVDVDKLVLSQPDTGEQALEIVEALIRSNAVDLIVVDSVAALVPAAEIIGDMGDSHMGLHARLMSQAMRKLSGIINKALVTVIFINQVREKMGGGPSYPGYVPETTTGGRALKFYASLRLEVKSGEHIKNGDQVLGKKTKIKLVKNKVAPPFKVAHTEIMFGKGLSVMGELIDVAVDRGIFQKAAAWYSYNETRLCQGREKLRAMLETDEAFRKEIEEKLKQR